MTYLQIQEGEIRVTLQNYIRLKDNCIFVDHSFMRRILSHTLIFNFDDFQNMFPPSRVITSRSSTFTIFLSLYAFDISC